MIKDIVDFSNQFPDERAGDAFTKEILEAFQGRLVILWFWRSNCPACTFAADDAGMMPLVINDADEAVVLCKINLDDGDTFPGSHLVAEFFEVFGLPTFIFLKDRSLVEYIPGAVKGEKLLRLISKYLQGEQFPENENQTAKSRVGMKAILLFALPILLVAAWYFLHR